MVGMENLNSAESREMSAEMMNENEAADRVAKSEKKDVQNAIDDINQKSPMDYFWLKTDAAKTIITQICWKENINQVTMKDILSLHPLKKSQLAWELSALRPLDDKIVNKVNINTLRKLLNKWWNESIDMSIASLNEKMHVTLNEQQWMTVFQVVKQEHNKMARNEYIKMFKKWDQIPPMQEITTLATWDLWSTTGIWWKWNRWRIYFDYNLNSPNTIERSLNFWALDGPAEIWISANWINIWKDWRWGWSFDFRFANWWVVHGEYTADWLIIDKWSLPTWIKRENWVLIIPKEYKNIPITIKTKSNRYSTRGEYDEVMFNFSCKNASIDRHIASSMNDVEWSRNFWLWEYLSSPEEKNDFWAWITAITKATKNSFAENIPVTLWVIIDKTKFNPQKIDWFMASTADFGFDKVMENYQNREGDKEQLKMICNELFNNFRSKINVSNFQWEKEQKAQQRLAECRFWEAIWIALKKQEFKKQLLSWKIRLDTQFAVWNERKIKTSLNEQDLIAVK